MPSVLLSRDLLFSSQFQGAARARGVEGRVALSIDELLTQAARGGQVFLDLSWPGLDLPEVVTRLRQLEAPVTIVAFGAHVQQSLLEAARAAGCDRVMARSEFSMKLSELVE
jgi:CheY-like chemotaxis protein